MSPRARAVRAVRTPRVPSNRKSTPSRATQDTIDSSQPVFSQTFMGYQGWTPINAVALGSNSEPTTKRRREDDLSITINTIIKERTKRSRSEPPPTVIKSEPVEETAGASTSEYSRLTASAASAVGFCAVNRELPDRLCSHDSNSSDEADTISVLSTNSKGKGHATSPPPRGPTSSTCAIANHHSSKNPAHASSPPSTSFIHVRNPRTIRGRRTKASAQTSTSPCKRPSSPRKAKWTGRPFPKLILEILTRARDVAAVPGDKTNRARPMTITHIQREIEIFRLAYGYPEPALGQTVRAAVLRGCVGEGRKGLWEHVCEGGKRVGGYKLL